MKMLFRIENKIKINFRLQQNMKKKLYSWVKEFCIYKKNQNKY